MGIDIQILQLVKSILSIRYVPIILNPTYKSIENRMSHRVLDIWFHTPLK